MFLREVGDQYFCIRPEIVKGVIFTPLKYLCSIVSNYIIHQLSLCLLKVILGSVPYLRVLYGTLGYFRYLRRPIDCEIFLQGDLERAYYTALKRQSRHFTGSPG